MNLDTPFHPEEEKKEPEPMSHPVPEESDGAPSPSPPPSNIKLSPSKQRAKAASSAGLSELSKQLRILQSKNEGQSIEINRLERQLRILAELQGISVADLRKALEDACANEAFGELQHRVAKLRAELEAATLAKQKELQSQGGSEAGSHIANLELRIGELEEVEEKHQNEIHHLYEELRHERARATRLKAEGKQHKQDANDYADRLNKEISKASKFEASYQEQLQRDQMQQARRMQEMAKLAKEAEKRASKDPKDADSASLQENGRTSSVDANSGNNSTSPEHGSDIDSLNAPGRLATAGAANEGDSNYMAAEYERMVQLLKQKNDTLREAEARYKVEQEKWMKQLREQEEKLRQAQMNGQVEKDQMALTVKELKDVDSQSELRLAQFKARFNVQDERIADMEQQLNSLYTAFGFVKEEQEAEDMKRAALQHNLHEADEEMARQVEDGEKKNSQSQRNVMSPTGSRAAAPSRREENSHGSNNSTATPKSAAGIPRTIQTPTTVVSTPGMASPMVTAQRLETPAPSVTAQPYTPTPPRTPGTWQLLFPHQGTNNTQSFASPSSNGGPQDGLLIKGILLVKSKSVMRKWKSKFSKLYLQRNHYQWDMEGKSYTLGCGISKLDFYPNHPLSFTVYTNPFDDMAPVVHAAASNKEDYDRWMAALTKATTGRDDELASLEGGPRRSEAVARPASASRQVYSGGDSVVSGLSVEDQEAADLERALMISQTMT